jgi:hypothetical protein
MSIIRRRGFKSLPAQRLKGSPQLLLQNFGGWVCLARHFSTRGAGTRKFAKHAHALPATHSLNQTAFGLKTILLLLERPAAGAFQKQKSQSKRGVKEPGDENSQWAVQPDGVAAREGECLRRGF